MGVETLLLRKEIKYVMPLSKALAIKEYLDSLLPRDEYCTDGAYLVRSLYFDSVNSIDFSDKLAGIDIRKKVRIRIYDNDDSLCKLEVKQKQGDWQHKQSCIIDVDDVKKLSKGNYSVLKKYFCNTETALKIYSIMAQGGYRPVVQIEYDRWAYRYPLYDTRITLDKNIRATESNLDIFESEGIFNPVMCKDVVLEIKYSGKLMGFVSDMLAQFGLTQGAYSKYCSGRRVYNDFGF